MVSSGFIMTLLHAIFMASAAARHLKYQKVETYGSSGLGYVAARDLVREKGGLASALLVDNYFLGERTLPSKPQIFG